MNRVMLCVLAALLIFSGCAQSQEDPFKVDTVVRIPVDPTDEPTEELSIAHTETPTEEITEASTEEITEPEETEAKKTAATSKSSTSNSSKKSSSSSKKNSSSKKENKPKETKPRETEPKEAESVETEPLVVETEEPTEPPFDPSSHEMGALEYDILDALNANRTDSDVGELEADEWLSGIACLRAREASFSWSHTRPDGRSFKSALSDYGYGYDDAVELMVHTSGNGDAQAFVDRWMASETHSANILSDGFTTVGIGAYDKDGVTYVVCLLVE